MVIIIITWIVNHDIRKMRVILVFTLPGSAYSLDLMLIPLPQVTLQPVQAPQEPVSQPSNLELDSDSGGKYSLMFKGFYCVLRCAVFACLIL